MRIFDVERKPFLIEFDTDALNRHNNLTHRQIYLLILKHIEGQSTSDLLKQRYQSYLNILKYI